MAEKEIYDYVRRLIDSLGKFNGGFIGLVEDYYSLNFLSKKITITVYKHSKI